jgi:hypothetical protein
LICKKGLSTAFKATLGFLLGIIAITECVSSYDSSSFYYYYCQSLAMLMLGMGAATSWRAFIWIVKKKASVAYDVFENIQLTRSVVENSFYHWIMFSIHCYVHPISSKNTSKLLY